MTRAEFDAAMPSEFWRDVVDRVAVEAPDTLLLAEAFWMMEGYFVRTLGMHRVYNSAFMHMLRDEQTGKYRQLIKNTLEFDPQILKRHVNFMSNPDEETAIDQFGTGDKYFGVCTRAWPRCRACRCSRTGRWTACASATAWNTAAPRWMSSPTRPWSSRMSSGSSRCFATAACSRRWSNFTCSISLAASGKVNENVLAYSNRSGSERALVLYHNKRAAARGWVRNAAPGARQALGQAPARIPG